jgi:hypothetical protein
VLVVLAAVTIERVTARITSRREARAGETAPSLR